ncbi:MAG TPA: serine/threonine-protein kinase [Blastocatellia bacterium]|nr:serine/threonine-protein kinase [Blastocatellia bacterium]
MSGFEFKKATAIEPGQADGLSAARETTERSASDVTEVLSRRFGSLSLLSERGDVCLWKGRDLAADNRMVILRVLQARPYSSRQRDLFRLEALAASKLVHQNILRSTPAVELDGILFSVMEHRPEVETLKQLLERRGWLDLKLAIGIVHQLADALEYAHQLGVLHLRVHPANILIDADGMALLADFGLDADPDLAWAHNERSSLSPIHYISPEQASGKPVDSRSDLYSLGVVFYKMLTDRVPVDSEDPNTIRLKHLSQTPPAPHLYSSDIPMPVSAVVARLLEKYPNRRFQDIASLRAQLDAPDSQKFVPVTPDEDLSPARLETDHQEISKETYSVSNREPWEPPMIRVIDPPVEAAATESVSPEANLEEDAVAEESNESDQSVRYGNLLVENLGKVHSESTTQWRPIVLVIILATAALIGLIVLARADRRETPTVTTRDPIGNIHSSEAGEIRDTATPHSVNQSRSGSLSGSQNPVGDQALQSVSLDAKESGPIGFAAPVNRTAIRQRPPRSQRSYASRRNRKPRRRWQQPTRYFGESWSADRRYYRPR